MFGYAAYAEAPFSALVGAGNVVFDVSVLESGSALDVIVVSSVVGGSVLESGSALDLTIANIPAINTSVVESVSGLEVFNSVATYNLVIPESVSILDPVSGGVVYSNSVTESSSSADSVTSGISFPNFVPVSASCAVLTASDTANFSNVIESASGGISVSSVATFVSTVTDTTLAQAFPRSNINAPVTITESAQMADAYFGLDLDLREIVESAAVSSDVSAALVASRTFVEAASIEDSVLGITGPKLVSVIETASGGETFSVLVDFTSTVLNTASAAETVAGNSFKLGEIVEVVIATPEFTAGGTAFSTFVEAVSVADTALGGSGSGVLVIDAAAITDQNAPRDFWNLINTYQDANWGSITTQP